MCFHIQLKIKMRKFLVFLACLFIVSNPILAGEKTFVRPSSSDEYKALYSEARKIYASDSKAGIAKMKEVIAYCIEQKEDSVNLFNAHYNLAILFYQLPEMDSALFEFGKCLDIAKRIDSHYFYYKAYIGFQRINSYWGHYDSAQYYAEQGLQHSLAIDYKIGISNNYTQLGVLAGHRGDNAKAIYYKEKSLELAKENNDTLGTFNGAYNLAIHYQLSKQYKKSLDYSVFVYDYSKQTGYAYQHGLANSVLSQTYTTLGDYEKALNYAKLATESHLKAIKKSEVESHIKWVVFTYLNRGVIYNHLDSTTLARHYIKKAILYYDSTNRLESRAGSYATYSDSFRKDGLYDSALFYAGIAKNLGDASGHINEKLTGNICLAKSYHALANQDSASYYAGISIELSKQYGYYGQIEEAAKILFDVYDQKGDNNKALFYLKELMAAKDTMENELRVKSTTRTSMQFDFDNEKRELEFQKEKQALVLNQQIQKEKVIQYGAFGGILLVSIAAFGFYRSYMAKKLDTMKIAEQAHELQGKNEQLNELSRYKEGLSHMIIHDMKNPLNVILGLTDQKIPDHENTLLINQSAHLILQLTHDIMDIQKFEEAKMQLDRDSFLFHQVVSHAKDQVALLLKVKNINLKIDIQVDLVVSVDFRLISRVLINLITNSIKYSSVGSDIKINASGSDEGFCTVSVVDNGQGIAEDQIPYVFDKFWQVYAKNSGQTYSTGLGLTFCRLATEAHGGEITVKSQLGVGSTFSFNIPLSIDKPVSIANQEKEPYTPVSSEIFYSTEDKKVLLPIIDKVKHFPIYKAGEIEKILEQVKSGSSNVDEWVQAVKYSIFSWDQQRFDDLLRLGENSVLRTGTD